jgi:hypothetical protein
VDEYRSRPLDGQVVAAVSPDRQGCPRAPFPGVIPSQLVLPGDNPTVQVTMLSGPLLSRILRLSIVTLLLQGAAGCVGPFDNCGTDLGRFAVRITVLDAATGSAPATRPTLTVTDGPYVETVQGPEPGSMETVIMPAGTERPGVYRVEVTAAGYQPWIRDGIRVTRRGRCDHLGTADITARLSPQ